MRAAATVILALGLTLARLPAQHSFPPDKLEVELRDLSKRHSYHLKDSVLLDVEIINSGSEPVGVFTKLGMGYQGGIILHALDSTGAEAQPQILPHDFFDFRAIDNPKSYFELQSHQFFGMRQNFDVLELVSKPGYYKLLAEYHCPVEAKYGKVENFWSIERKSVVSREIPLNVK